MTFRHIKGFSFSIPSRIKQVRDEIAYKVKFNKSCRYQFNDEDDKDWNKLFGAKFYFFNPHRESVMVGWRNGTMSPEYELCVYMHLSGERVFTKPLLKVQEEDDLRIRIGIDKSNKLYKVFFSVNGEESQYFQKKYYHNRKKSWFISPWFGGNKSAPHCMKIELNTWKK